MDFPFLIPCASHIILYFFFFSLVAFSFWLFLVVVFFSCLAISSAHPLTHTEIDRSNCTNEISHFKYVTVILIWSCQHWPAYGDSEKVCVCVRAWRNVRAIFSLVYMHVYIHWNCSAINIFPNNFFLLTFDLLQVFDACCCVWFHLFYFFFICFCFLSHCHPKCRMYVCCISYCRFWRSYTW